MRLVSRYLHQLVLHIKHPKRSSADASSKRDEIAKYGSMKECDDCSLLGSPKDWIARKGLRRTDRCSAFPSQRFDSSEQTA